MQIVKVSYILVYKITVIVTFLGSHLSTTSPKDHPFKTSQLHQFPTNSPPRR